MKVWDRFSCCCLLYIPTDILSAFSGVGVWKLFYWKKSRFASTRVRMEYPVRVNVSTLSKYSLKN
ncbi:hypothetical protein BDW02DRAFT_569688 [Decorospora gaudefroyi]|uniref:Uncharacterized protein n=1 Tax=Decorospora gaudefroyi TaxID=184978 RepID=A0A6A5KH71_9PLEO|nr:hypothetical protein BDW02DRAFT_569688 [Decorospora gaudefroyi]